MKLALWRVAEFTTGSGKFRPDGNALGYSIDSRSVKPGDLFFAVKGERLDGHDFVQAALEHGAVAAVVARDRVATFPDKSKLIVVWDTLQALQQLSAMVRCLWGKPVVGVTGSAGKTTNCQIGVSLTVTAVDGETFSVSLIPHTQAVTTLGGLCPGSRVNLEADVLGRYVERLVSAARLPA